MIFSERHRKAGAAENNVCYPKSVDSGGVHNGMKPGGNFLSCDWIDVCGQEHIGMTPVRQGKGFGIPEHV